MHRELRNHLRSASGSSEFVIAVNVDIRGFSSFFSDSSQAAAFLSSAYTRILDNYFPDVSFFKPTGDGLLIVKSVVASTGPDDLNRIVSGCLKLDEQFEHICQEDWLINFGTPSRVGIGIARGTATRLASGELTLDYSGYPLNLATRLMDLARPHGVVFDASLGPEVLDSSAMARFQEDSVYVRGLADAEPLKVFLTADVDVAASNRQPFGAEVFREKPVKKPLSVLQKHRPRFIHRLTHIPMSKGSIRVGLKWPAATASGRKSSHFAYVFDFREYQYETDAEGAKVIINYDFIAAYLQEEGCKRTWEVEFNISYAVPVGTATEDSPQQHLLT